jgi:hypothetical protein
VDAVKQWHADNEQALYKAGDWDTYCFWPTTTTGSWYLHARWLADLLLLAAYIYHMLFAIHPASKELCAPCFHQ